MTKHWIVERLTPDQWMSMCRAAGRDRCLSFATALRQMSDCVELIGGQYRIRNTLTGAVVHDEFVYTPR